MVILAYKGDNDVDETDKPQGNKVIGDVDNNDLSIVANVYNKIKDNSDGWNEDEDFINDGIIGRYDMIFISSKL